MGVKQTLAAKQGIGLMDSSIDIKHACLTGLNVTLVASAGNDGKAAFPRYPAAYPEVIAVTAVDQDLNVYDRAAQGAHIELAAPGVNILIAKGQAYGDRKSTRLNSSHVRISYAVFC